MDEKREPLGFPRGERARTMWAVPFVRLDQRGVLDVEQCGAQAIFCNRDIAREFVGEGAGPREPVKVKVTLVRSGRRKQVAGRKKRIGRFV